MTYRVEVEKKAAKQLAALQTKTRARVYEVLNAVATEPRCYGVIKLTRPEVGISNANRRHPHQVHDL